jgi:hypothetical protein
MPGQRETRVGQQLVCGQIAWLAAVEDRLGDVRGPAGFVNYYLITLVGRRQLRVAVVDFIVDDALVPYRAGCLLRASLTRMQNEGAQAALTLGPPVHRSGRLLSAGFLPLPKVQCLIYLPVDPAVCFPGARRMHLHWR